MWAATGGTCALLAFLPAMTAASWLTDQLGGTNPLRLAVAAALWTSLGVGSVVVLGRLFGVVRPLNRGSAMLTAVGALAAAGAQAAIWLSAEVRYGPNPEVDYIGWAVLLTPVLTVLIGALVAFTVARGPARILAAGMAWLAIAAVGFLLLDSLPGVVDGISPAGWLAAPAFAVALSLAALSAVLLLRRPPAIEPGS
jgi:hypothetical protein